jgi:hypothetical protein
MERSRDTAGLARWLPLTGLAFVVVVVAAFAGVAGDTPESDASATAIASFYRDHQTAGLAVAFLLAAAAPLLVIFGVNLALALSDGDGARSGLWPTVLIVGSGIGATSFIVAAHGAYAVADGVDHLTPATLQGLNVLDSDSWIAFNSALGIMLLGAAGSLIPRGARLLGGAALVLGVGLFIPFADFAALLLTGIWMIAASILQFRGSAALLPTPRSEPLARREVAGELEPLDA